VTSPSRQASEELEKAAKAGAAAAKAAAAAAAEEEEKQRKKKAAEVDFLSSGVLGELIFSVTAFGHGFGEVALLDKSNPVRTAGDGLNRGGGGGDAVEPPATALPPRGGGSRFFKWE
jgi:hypothetical protein